MAKLAEKAFKLVAGLEAFPQPPVIPLAEPLVMMHGFGMLASLRRGGHLHDEALYLRGRGVRAYAPNVSPYQTVPARAAVWKTYLEHILHETRAEALHLVAHSMGGLDARYLIHELGMHTVVRTLVTISTPHRGTALADAMLEQPDRLRDWITGFANWIGATTLDNGSADFRQAVANLRPAYMNETFNPAVPDHPDVRYYSYAGQAGLGTDLPINPFLRPQNKLLYEKEGVNDGFVSVKSARWGGFLGTLDADHTQQIGLPFTPNSTFDDKAFYAALAQMIADLMRDS